MKIENSMYRPMKLISVFLLFSLSSCLIHSSDLIVHRRLDDKLVMGSSYERSVKNAVWLKTIWAFENSWGKYDTMWCLINRKNDSILQYRNITILKYQEKYKIIEEKNDSVYAVYKVRKIKTFKNEKQIPDSIGFKAL